MIFVVEESDLRKLLSLFGDDFERMPETAHPDMRGLPLVDRPVEALVSMGICSARTANFMLDRLRDAEVIWSYNRNFSRIVLTRTGCTLLGIPDFPV